jgi:putative ABC transport system permease protein
MAMYLPLSQEHKSTVQLVVRTPLPTSRTSEALREAMRQSDPELPLYGVRTLAQHVDRSIYLDRLRASLISALAALALAIAAVGVYGLVSFGVAERTREVGIRMALGATPGELLRMLLASGGRVAIWGVLAGGLLALWGTQHASSALYGITRLDVLAWLGAAALLVVVVLLATIVPALRATRIDPMNALRLE